MSEGAGALQLSGPKVRSSANQLHNESTALLVTCGVFFCILGSMRLHSSTVASQLVALFPLARTPRDQSPQRPNNHPNNIITPLIIVWIAIVPCSGSLISSASHPVCTWLEKASQRAVHATIRARPTIQISPAGTRDMNSIAGLLTREPQGHMMSPKKFFQEVSILCWHFGQVTVIEILLVTFVIGTNRIGRRRRVCFFVTGKPSSHRNTPIRSKRQSASNWCNPLFFSSGESLCEPLSTTVLPKQLSCFFLGSCQLFP